MDDPAMAKILIVEDEMLVAMALEDALADLGFRTVSASSVAQALDLIERETLGGALLDLNLGRERSYPVADALIARGLPVVFTTGYGDATIDRRYADIVKLGKPFDDARLRDVLSSARFPPQHSR